MGFSSQAGGEIIFCHDDDTNKNVLPGELADIVFFLNECWTLSLWMRWDFRIKNTYCLRVRGNNGCSATWSLLQVNIHTHTYKYTLTDSAIYRYFSEVYHFKNIAYRNYSRYKKMYMNKSVHCKTPGFLSSNKPEGHTHREFIYFLAASADVKPTK